jgi:Domain of unknown function (DUF4328)/Protein of unknown function (DUF2510)
LDEARTGLWKNDEVSEASGYPGAPPGWYPDPAGGPGRRWWDGYAWTEATVLPESPPPPPWYPGAPPQGPPTELAPWAVAGRLNPQASQMQVAAELRMTPLARFAVVLPAVNSLVNLVVQRIEADQWRSTGHQLRVAWDDAQRGLPAPPLHTATFSPIGSIVGTATIAAVVFACIWQYRAASAARSLGYPAARSPGWGVGCWFVPIVNLWMPYGAVRDCLPPGHPERARVLRWWVAWLCTGFFGLLSSAFALFSIGAGLAASIPAALAALAVIAWSPAIVTAIGMAHREAIEPLSR